jgi:hypothetical protein
LTAVTVIPTPTTTTNPTIPQSPLEAVEVLSVDATPEQVAAAIDVIAENLDTLTESQLDAIVEVISVAPTEVKREFENEVNIFSAGLDNYVPADSKITVAERRVLVAVGAVMVAAPAVVGRRK